MKKILIILSALPAIFIAGCVVTSVYPYYTDKDLTFNPGLLGTRTESKTNDSGTISTETWVCSKASENAYTYTGTTPTETNTFSAHLFKLGGKRFLDWYPLQKNNDFIPPHYLLEVRQVTPTPELVPMDYSWLEDLLAKHPNAVRHIRLYDKPDKSDKGRIVLTADTKELQKFVLKYMNNPQAFVSESTK
ncbi:MAG: hypothetical protein JWO95_3455 [Verrucomicrobiales bacterium]|nr:hypothetical protein [Verrucomicrobiales bacterium]